VTRSALLLAGALLGTAGCGPVPMRHVVEIRDLSFGPAVVEVAVGDTIVWTNHDIFPHTSTVNGAAGWNTGLIPADSSRSSVVRRPGTFNYLCQVHPTMRGKVIAR
jgi:plastocyanin